MAQTKEETLLRDLVAGLIEQARANVNDCRMDYTELQMDKDTLDNLAVLVNKRPVDWHREPCKHDCFDCGILLCEPNPGCMGHVPPSSVEAHKGGAT